MEGFILFFAPLFIIGGIWSIIFFGFVFAVMVSLTESEHDFFAVVTLGILVWGFLSFNPALTVPTIGTLLKYFAYYFVAGALWSVGKWYFYVVSAATILKETKLAFFKHLNEHLVKNNRSGDQVKVDVTTKIDTEFENDFKEFVYDEYVSHIQKLQHSPFREYMSQFIPNASKNKSRIVRWIIWWPLSLTWTMINDPIRKLANKIFDNLQGVYNKITNKVFANIID